MPVDTSAVSFRHEYKDLPCHAMDFLKSIDKDETVLVVMDCGKGNFGCGALFSELSDFLLTETHRMTIRVGGNSYRFAGELIYNLLERKMTNCSRFEFFRTSVKKDEKRTAIALDQRICRCEAFFGGYGESVHI